MVRVERTPSASNIYYLHPLLAGPTAAWRRHFLRANRMGFGHVCVGPIFAPAEGGDLFLVGDNERANPLITAGSADEAARQLAERGTETGLGIILDIVLDRIGANGQTARNNPHLFYRNGDLDVIDPRRVQLGPEALPARFDSPERERELAAWFADRLIRLTQAGIVGFRLLGLADVPSAFLGILIAAVRRECADCQFLGWTPGLPWPLLAGFERAGLDAVFASTPWWNARAAWFVEERNLLRRLAPRVIGMPEAPFEQRFAARRRVSGEHLKDACRAALRIAAATASGLLVPMGFEFGARHRMDARDSDPEAFARIEAEAPFDLGDEIRAANELTRRIAARGTQGEMRSLFGAGAAVTALLQVDASDARNAEHGTLTLINTETRPQQRPAFATLPPAAGAPFADPHPIEHDAPDGPLAAREVRLLAITRTRQVAERARRAGGTLSAAVDAPRIALERLTPAVDGGAFAVKRLVGESITVEVDVIADGHDVVAAELLWKAADEKSWTRAPLSALGNDRWRGTFMPNRVGNHQFTVEAWRDDYALLVHEVEVKHRAGLDIASELTEAQRYLESLRARAVPCNTTALGAALRALDANDAGASVQALAAPATTRAVTSIAERAFLARHPPIPLAVERPQAAFGSWYELFPRSQSGEARHHGTFDDVIARLPDVRRMGFDVLYFPPIHPIGRKNRKGRNNTLSPAPDDVGSPYAIGATEGGHDAIHPQLGTLEDFRRLVAAARENGLEIALDFAIQCSPDHPWLREHPEWFNWRPDGSIKYAENPPKKYEDIVNVDFYREDARGLWAALRTIVLYWAGEGVRIFRVDNPHTKPLPFWQWMIADVRSLYPDVIFLSEAFTRPKMMYRLAKVGFSQSYTYFTWRNTKQELTDYLIELTTTDVKEFFRPNFFVNTPDINPYFLQTSGRAGFLIRAVLAATLSGLWGVYAGFELCEAAALPGREEYLDSEKYQIRVRDQNAPGNIVAEITMLNRLRRAHPALQSHLGVKFYNAFNDQILLYGKMTPARDDIILIAVSLDPHNAQEATFELPLWEWKLPDNGSLLVEDLVRENTTIWSGKLQRVRLDPVDLPYAIWRITPAEHAP
jgi:starch synthase (maltosyl-transferring)